MSTMILKMTDEEVASQVIGKPITETAHLDWMGMYPAVDRVGVIREVLPADGIPYGAILLNSSLCPTDGERGFSAVDYYSY